MIERKELLYEGKAKKVCNTDSEDHVIVSYKDVATAFNGQKNGAISGKGAINNKVSNHLFKMLKRHDIPTHYVEELSEKETLVKRV